LVAVDSIEFSLAQLEGIPISDCENPEVSPMKYLGTRILPLPAG
jgi:hypothetical protein